MISGQGMYIDIVISDNINAPCVDFIRSTPGAKLCHLPVWTNMVEDLFGHKGHYLVARNNGVICGVLPLSHVRSRLFGNHFVSQPFSDYGGLLAASPAVSEALYEHAVELAKQYKCDYIEFRNTVALPQEMHLRTDEICMHLPLASDPEVVWKGLGPQIRDRIRQAEKSGIRVINGHCEMLDDFYRLWTIRMRELGTPCYSRELFRGIMERFKDNSRIFLALSDNKIAAAFFVYTFNGCVHSRWGATLREYDSSSSNYLLNWSAIEYYCRAGMKWFDFGRGTVGSRHHAFEKQWGASPVPLYWQYWIRPGSKLNPAKSDAPKYGRKAEIWKRIPLTVTRVIGPHISCSLP